MWLLLSAVAQAAVFNVNSTIDRVDIDPSDGLCLTIDDECTLRAAVMQANETTTPDVIILPFGDYVLTLQATIGASEDEFSDLDVLQPLTIYGVGPYDSQIFAGPELFDRVLEVHGTEFRAYSLGMLNGITPSVNDGGGLLAWDAKVELENVLLENNWSFGSGGGLMAKDSDVTWTTGGLIRNTAADNGGGIAQIGGTMLLDRILFATNNTGNNGGGLWVSDASFVELDEGYFEDNGVAEGTGEGAYFERTGFYMLESIFINHRSRKSVIAVDIEEEEKDNHGTILHTNVDMGSRDGVTVFSGDVSIERSAIISQSLVGLLVYDGDVNVEHTTVGLNEEGIVQLGGTVRASHLTIAENNVIGVSGAVELSDSIIADNPIHCSASVLSSGTNFFDTIGTSTCFSVGDILHFTNPLLPLSTVGWPVGELYYPLNPAQTLTQEISTTNCTTDQIGNPRNTPCDLGAVELLFSPE